MSRELGLLLAKKRLERVDGETVLAQTVEYLAKMLPLGGVVEGRPDKSLSIIR